MPWMQSKFGGTCRECGDHLEAGDTIYYRFPEGKKPGAAYCEVCGPAEAKADAKK